MRRPDDACKRAMLTRSKILIFIFFCAVYFVFSAQVLYCAENSVTINYSDARVFNNNGVDFVAQGKYAEAAKEFEKALALDSNFHAAKYNLALAHYNMGMIKEAIKEFEYLVNSAFYFVNAHYNLGTIYLREGLIDKAAEQLKIVAELEPNHPEAHFNLGYIYFKKNLFDEAMAEYKKGVQMRPDSVKGRLSLAFIYEKKSMYDEAIAEYSEVLKLAPENDTAIRAIGALKAIPRIKEYLSYNPKDVSGFICLGHIYYAREMYEEAIDNYRKALDLDPKNRTAKTAVEKSTQLWEKNR